MICKNCGNDIREGERACPRCGAEASRVVAPPSLQADSVTLRSMSLPASPGVGLPSQVRTILPLCHLAVALCNMVLLTFWFTGKSSSFASRYGEAEWVNTAVQILCVTSGLISLLCGLTPLGKKPRRVLLAIQLAAALWTLFCFWSAVFLGFSQSGPTLEEWVFAILTLGLFTLLAWMMARSFKKKR